MHRSPHSTARPIAVAAVLVLLLDGCAVDRVAAVALALGYTRIEQRGADGAIEGSASFQVDAVFTATECIRLLPLGAPPDGLGDLQVVAGERTFEKQPFAPGREPSGTLCDEARYVGVLPLPPAGTIADLHIDVTDARGTRVGIDVPQVLADWSIAPATRALPPGAELTFTHAPRFGSALLQGLPDDDLPLPDHEVFQLVEDDGTTGRATRATSGAAPVALLGERSARPGEREAPLAIACAGVARCAAELELTYVLQLDVEGAPPGF